MDAMNQQVEIDALRRFGSFGRIRRRRPLGGVGVGRVVAEDAHLDVVAIAAVQRQFEMTLVAIRDFRDFAPGLNR